MDYADYQPAPAVLGHVRQVDFVAIVGPTAVGKTTLIKAAAAKDPGLHMLVAGVSRPMRPGEVDHADFHFGDKAEMAKRASGRTYVTVVVGATGDLYTTAPEDYPKDKAVLQAVMAHGMQLFRAIPFKSFRTIFIVPPDADVWHERLSKHPFSPEELARRMREAEVSLQFALSDPDVLFLVNDDLETAVNDLVAMALGRALDDRQQAAHARGKTIAAHLLEGVQAGLRVKK
jgi:guanylate kinase